MMTAHDYALARGWDYSCIEATARLGVSEEDIATLSETDLTSDELEQWCRERVAAQAG